VAHHPHTSERSLSGPDATRTGSSAAGSSPAPELRWWKEALYTLGFYVVYSVVRNTQGSGSVSKARAFHNARTIIALERHLGLFHEQAVQHAFVHWRWFIEGWDVFYGAAHFVVTAVAIIWMFRAFKQRYPLWRNTLACTTALALVGFAFFPLMPPRLLATMPGTHFGLVDTLKTVGGLWSFDSGTMQKVSNQYAAMPSLHFAWSTWCALVLFPQVRSRRAKLAVASYPGLTLFAVVVTANHFVLDAVGGGLVLGAGYLAATGLTLITRPRAARARRGAGMEPFQEATDEPDDDARRVAAG